jgi:hypothetical protein
MRVRTGMIATALIAITAVGGMSLSGHQQADAGTTNVSTSTTTKTIVNAKCYNQVTRTVTTYHHTTKGWVKYPAPKVTTTTSEHCYK